MPQVCVESASAASLEFRSCGRRLGAVSDSPMKTELGRDEPVYEIWGCGGAYTREGIETEALAVLPAGNRQRSGKAKERRSCHLQATP